jgi:hypothetical protein
MQNTEKAPLYQCIFEKRLLVIIIDYLWLFYALSSAACLLILPLQRMEIKYHLY